VRWRTGRHREALWKSLVLPAGGVALCWLLLLTLWLPPLDYARSPRALVSRLAQFVPASACVAAPGLSPSAVAALEVFGRWRVDAREQAAQGPCPYLVQTRRLDRTPTPPGGWTWVAEARKPTDRNEVTLIYRRTPAP
jgi:hypothetical protein